MDKTNIKQITYFIEFIPYWSPGNNEDAHEFFTKFFFKLKRGIYSQY